MRKNGIGQPVEFAGKLREFTAAGFAQAMQREPCAALCAADFLGEFQAADSLTRSDEHVHRQDPLPQCQVAALEDRASADREFTAAGTAAVEPGALAAARGDALRAAARRAADPGRPVAGLKVLWPCGQASAFTALMVKN